MLQLMVDFRPSCCRTWGYMAFAFTAFAAFMGSDASSRHHTPLFFPTHPPSFNISLHESDRLPPSAVHWPVLLLPSGSYAKLNVSAVDGSGNPRLLPTTFFLGPDDNHPWISEVGAATKPAGAATSTTAAPAAGGESFAASSRRRLRGFAMRGGFGGARIGGFTRGTGSFSSPHRGSITYALTLQYVSKKRPSPGCWRWANYGLHCIHAQIYYKSADTYIDWNCFMTIRRKTSTNCD